MSGEFRHDVRVLLCDGCGAPFQVPTSGGRVQCRYCGTPAEAAGREEIDLSATGATEADEAMRIEILRAQDKALTHVFPNLADDNLDLALELWRQSLAECRSSYTPKAEARLFDRAMSIANRCTARNELARGRAVVDTTLGEARARRHAQVLRCWMSRMAVQVGDGASAEQWLSRCDPRSEDLHMDTAYRVSQAELRLQANAPEAALHHLGARYDDIPFLGVYDSLASLMRAQALELTKGPDEGARELHRGAAGHPNGWARMVELLEHHPSWCKQSVARAPTLFAPWRRSLILAAVSGTVAVLFALAAAGFALAGAEGSISGLAIAAGIFSLGALGALVRVLAARAGLGARLRPLNDRATR